MFLSWDTHRSSFTVQDGYIRSNVAHLVTSEMILAGAKERGLGGLIGTLLEQLPQMDK